MYYCNCYNSQVINGPRVEISNDAYKALFQHCRLIFLLLIAYFEYYGRENFSTPK